MTTTPNRATERQATSRQTSGLRPSLDTRHGAVPSATSAIRALAARPIHRSPLHSAHRLVRGPWFEGNPRSLNRSSGTFAAVQEPSVLQHLPTPKILSAIKQNCSETLPVLILCGGDPSLRVFPGLRLSRTIPRTLGKPHSFARTHVAPPGTPDVDKKTGAAIQRLVIPGESK